MATKKIANVSQAITAIGEMNKPEDLSNYGKEFQVKLIALLVKDRVFSFSIMPIIKDEYFTDIYLRKIFLVVKAYMDRFNACPSTDNVKILLREAGENMTVYDKLVDSIEDVSLGDRDFVMMKAKDFCFEKHVTVELAKAQDLINKGDVKNAQAVASEAFKFSGLNSAKMYDLHEDIDLLFDEATVHQPVATPFPIFNENMNGGPGNGNLVIMVAESNFGKTNALIAIARHANSIGKNVLFFSFEIGGGDMLRRHVAGLNNLRQEEVKNNRKIIEGKLAEEGLGRFKLIEERATNARMATIRSHIDYVKSTGFFPDLICVDAINQLKLPIGTRVNSDNEKFELLAEELRDLANEESLPLYTVMQTNRSGFNSEIVDIQAIGKAIEPFQVADVLITFSQTRTEQAENKCKAFLVKNRLGKKNILLSCYYDPNKCVFQEIAQIDDLLMLTDKQKEGVKNTAADFRNRLQEGKFDTVKK